MMVLNTALDITSLTVVGLFLLVTLLLGLYAGRNVKDFKDYALGRRRFSTTTLTLTFLATNIGGFHSIGMVDLIYNLGIIVVIGFSSILIRNILLGFFFAGPISRVKNSVSIGEVMGGYYGKNIQILTGLLTCMYGICIASMQLTMIGNIFHIFYKLSFTYSIIIAGIILGIYSSYGGIKSVTFTDIFQFLIFIIAIPLIANLVLKTIGGYQNIFNMLPREKLEIVNHSKLYYYLFYFIMMGFLPESLINPTFFHRLLMSNSKKEMRNVLFFSGIFRFIFLLIIMIISFSAICLLKVNYSENILFNLLNNLIFSSITKGFIICGLLSILMSTTDSFYHTCGIIISNDILKNLKRLKGKSFDTLKISKFSTIIISVFSIVIAINSYHIIKISILSMQFAAPILLFPLMIGLLEIKVNKNNFIAGGIAGIIGLFISKQFLSTLMQPLSIPIGIICNSISFMLSHIIQNRGIAIINRDYHEERPQKIWKPTWQGFVRTFASIIPTPHKIFEASRKSVVRCGANNMLFGIFVCINFIVPYFMWDHTDEDLYNLMIYLRFFGGLLGGLLIVKSEWKDFLKPYFPLFWHFSLLYCLPFISTVMFLLTKGSIIWLMNIGTSIFFLIMLAENAVFLTLTPIGVATGILFYMLRVGPIEFSSFSFEITYQLIYQLVFSSIIGLLFSYRKKIFNTIKGHEGTNLGLALCHELRNTGLYVYPAAQVSLMYLKKYKNQPTVKNDEKGFFIKEQHFEFINEQNEEIERLGKLQVNIVGAFEKLLKEYRDSINDPQNFSMKFLINQTLKQYIFKQGQKEKLEIDLENDFVAKVPKRVFVFVIDNIIRNAYKHGAPTKIKVWLENNELHIKDNGTGIKESEMEKIFKMHFTTGSGSSSGIGLAFAKQIVEGFSGEIWVESETGEKSYTEFIIKFPKISEDLSEEEKLENAKIEARREIAKSMKESKADEEFIKKTTGYSLKDLE